MGGDGDDEMSGWAGDKQKGKNIQKAARWPVDPKNYDCYGAMRGNN
jgi:hypothetical protein